MARIALATTEITRSGIDVATLTAANADGHWISNNNNDTFLYVKNGSGASIDVTVQTPRTVDGLAVSELVVAVAASGAKLIGPFPTATFNQTGANRGKVYVDYSSATTVTVKAFKLS